MFGCIGIEMDRQESNIQSLTTPMLIKEKVNRKKTALNSQFFQSSTFAICVANQMIVGVKYNNNNHQKKWNKMQN